MSADLFLFLPVEAGAPTHALLPCMAPACTLYYDVDESYRRQEAGAPRYTTSTYTEVTCPVCLERWGGVEGLLAESRRQQGRQAVIEG